MIQSASNPELRVCIDPKAISPLNCQFSVTGALTPATGTGLLGLDQPASGTRTFAR
jgi:hypothetical protein